MLATAEAFSRDEDQDALRVVFLAARGCCLHDIAADAERDLLWVIETLHAHRDLFCSQWLN